MGQFYIFRPIKVVLKSDEKRDRILKEAKDEEFKGKGTEQCVHSTRHHTKRKIRKEHEALMKDQQVKGEKKLMR